MVPPFEPAPTGALNFDASPIAWIPRKTDTGVPLDEAADPPAGADERLDRVSELLRSARQRLEGAVVVLAVGNDLAANARERQERIRTLCDDARARLNEACALLVACAGTEDTSRGPTARVTA